MEKKTEQIPNKTAIIMHANDTKRKDIGIIFLGSKNIYQPNMNPKKVPVILTFENRT